MHFRTTIRIAPICTRIIQYAFTQSTLRLPSFDHFPLHPTIFKYLEAQDIHTPTYCQYALYSSLFKNTHNIHHITAPTGSGKTLSYLLPIASQLKHQQDGIGAMTASQRPRAIVLTATKQLVLQCRQVGKQISHHCKLKVEGMGIGRTMAQEKQSVINGVDILMSTHSKLRWLMEGRTLFMTNVKWLVIDEVDTLFETAKLQTVLKEVVQRASKGSKDLRIILSGTTNPPDLKKVLKSKFEQYAEITDKKTHMNLQNIKHQFVQCYELNKHQTLLDVLFKRRSAKTLIFCNTVSSLHELQYFLESQGVTALSLHSQLHKKARLQNYQLFRDGQNNLLLSSDLGARGLDIPNLQRIINYDFPRSTVDYLQRAGRTGRASEPGQAVTLYHRKDLPIINQLKDCSFDRPLKVNNSAYRMQNRQGKVHQPNHTSS